jgi:hypothetical protein
MKHNAAPPTSMSGAAIVDWYIVEMCEHLGAPDQTAQLGQDIGEGQEA